MNEDTDWDESDDLATDDPFGAGEETSLDIYDRETCDEEE